MGATVLSLPWNCAAPGEHRQRRRRGESLLTKIRILFSLLLVALAGLAVAQTTIGGAAKVGGTTQVGGTTSGGGTAYASWDGIDAMSVPTVYYGDTTAAGAQIGSSNWQWYHDQTWHDRVLTVTNNANESLCPAGHNCVVFQLATVGGTDGFPSYLYLSPTYSSWSGDPTQHNGTQAAGGLWFQMYVRTDSATETYVNNSHSQIKLFLDRYDATAYPDANTNNPGVDGTGGGGFFHPGFGYDFWGDDYLAVQDDATTGNLITHADTGLTTGMLVKCQLRRDTTANLGHIACSANGSVWIDTEQHTTDTRCYGGTANGLGCTAYGSYNIFGGHIQLGTSATGYVMGFHPGIRYFQACDNSCADTTVKVVLSNIKVCGYNCVGYP
jgi:hypothetical protein